MPICSTFLTIIQAACHSGAMMGIMWSFLFVRFEGSIEWSYLDTIPWNHTRIWMKDVRLCHPNTQDHRIARCLWFFHSGIFISMDDVMPGSCTVACTLYCIVWYDGMKDPNEKLLDFSCKYGGQSIPYQCNTMSTIKLL